MKSPFLLSLFILLTSAFFARSLSAQKLDSLIASSINILSDSLSINDTGSIGKKRITLFYIKKIILKTKNKGVLIVHADINSSKVRPIAFSHYFKLKKRIVPIIESNTSTDELLYLFGKRKFRKMTTNRRKRLFEDYFLSDPNVFLSGTSYVALVYFDNSLEEYNINVRKRHPCD